MTEEIRKLLAVMRDDIPELEMTLVEWDDDAPYVDAQAKCQEIAKSLSRRAEELEKLIEAYQPRP